MFWLGLGTKTAWLFQEKNYSVKFQENDGKMLHYPQWCRSLLNHVNPVGKCQKLNSAFVVSGVLTKQYVLFSFHFLWKARARLQGIQLHVKAVIYKAHNQLSVMLGAWINIYKGKKNKTTNSVICLLKQKCCFLSQTCEKNTPNSARTMLPNFIQTLLYLAYWIMHGLLLLSALFYCTGVCMSQLVVGGHLCDAFKC